MLLVIALLGALLVAHVFWIEPDSFRPPVGARVGVGLRVGHDFEGEPVPRRPNRIVRFALCTQSNGPIDVLGNTGDEPAGTVTIASAGPQMLVYQSNRASIVLEGAKFSEYLRQQGLEQILARRARHNETNALGREVYSRAAKSRIVAGNEDADTTDLDQIALGLPLEIVWEAFPGALRLLYHGAPLGDATIALVKRGDPSFLAQTARTDAGGRARFTLPGGGVYLLYAVHMIPAPPDAPGADWESFWASLSFDIPKGG